MNTGTFQPKEPGIRTSYPDRMYQEEGCDKTRSTEEVIRARFAYHAPTAEQQQRYAILRTDFTNLAVRISQLVRPGSDRDNAIEALSQTLMLTNRAIALE